MFRPELVEADADDDEATEDMSIYRRVDDEVSNLPLNLAPRRTIIQHHRRTMHVKHAYDMPMKP